MATRRARNRPPASSASSAVETLSRPCSSVTKPSRRSDVHVTRLDYVVSRVAAAPMEPRGAVGEWDRRTGRYTLHTIEAGHVGRTRDPARHRLLVAGLP